MDQLPIASASCPASQLWSDSSGSVYSCGATIVGRDEGPNWSNWEFARKPCVGSSFKDDVSVHTSAVACSPRRGRKTLCISSIESPAMGVAQSKERQGHGLQYVSCSPQAFLRQHHRLLHPLCLAVLGKSLDVSCVGRNSLSG